MKKILLSVLVITSVTGFSQTVLNLKPGPTVGEDVQVHDLGLNTLPDLNVIKSSGWTWNNNPGVIRSFIKFDLTSIPQGSNVLDAKLSLWAGAQDQHSTLSGANANWLRRVTSTWDEQTLVWNTLPTTTTTNEVTLPTTTGGPTQDYLDNDVTAMVQDMVDNPSTSFGFVLLLKDENFYRRMTFASSDAADSTTWPELEITYNEPVGYDETYQRVSLSVHPNPSTGVFIIEGAPGTIEVLDIYGRLVLTTTLPQIDLSHQPKGIYFVRLALSDVEGSGQAVRKLVLR